MRRALTITGFILVAVAAGSLAAPELAPPPRLGGAASLAWLFPTDAESVVGIDVNGVTTSPLGKKVIGTDRPFEGGRKLLPLFGKALGSEHFGDASPLAAKRLDRVTTVYLPKPVGRPQPHVTFIEGEVGEGEYAKVWAGSPEVQGGPKDWQFMTEKVGQYQLLVLKSTRRNDNSTRCGVKLEESLFVVADSREAITDVIEKHAGKRKADAPKVLLDALCTVKPAETPIWRVIDGTRYPLKVVQVTTITLTADAELHVEASWQDEAVAKFIVESVDEDDKKEFGVFWEKGAVEFKRDGKKVTVTGRVSAKLLAEEYTKQK